MKTKYKSCLSATDELQYLSSGDKPVTSFKENAPREKKANYTASTVSAISGGKYVVIQTEQLTGAGVSSDKNIYNQFNELKHCYVDGSTPFNTIKRYAKKRLFKKNNIIYDLLN
jgi:hypothetical protein